MNTKTETVADMFRRLLGERPENDHFLPTPIRTVDLWDLVDEVFRLRERHAAFREALDLIRGGRRCEIVDGRAHCLESPDAPSPAAMAGCAIEALDSDAEHEKSIDQDTYDDEQTQNPDDIILCRQCKWIKGCSDTIGRCYSDDPPTDSRFVILDQAGCPNGEIV